VRRSFSIDCNSVTVCSRAIRETVHHELAILQIDCIDKSPYHKRSDSSGLLV
jgi:hypothetical protein